MEAIVGLLLIGTLGFCLHWFSRAFSEWITGKKTRTQILAWIGVWALPLVISYVFVIAQVNDNTFIKNLTSYYLLTGIFAGIVAHKLTAKKHKPKNYNIAERR